MAVKLVDEWTIGDFSTDPRELSKNVSRAKDWLYHEFIAAARYYKFDPTDSALALLTRLPFGVEEFTQRKSRSRHVDFEHPELTALASPALAEFDQAVSKLSGKPLTKSRHGRRGREFAAFVMAEDRILQRGRRVDVDIPLLLFLIYTIEGLIGRPFPYSRPAVENAAHRRPPDGPAFRLLRAAYSFASVKHHVRPAGLESLYRVVRLARSDGFRARLHGVWAIHQPFAAPPRPSDAGIVASWPAECAFEFATTARNRRRT